MGIPFNTCSDAILFNITSIIYFYIFIHCSSLVTYVLATMNRMALLHVFRESPSTSRESPWCHCWENHLIQVVAQGSLFSWISWISLNPDNLSQIFRVWIKWLSPVQSQNYQTWAGAIYDGYRFGKYNIFS